MREAIALRAEAEVERLRGALRGLMDLIDEGWLVRNTTNDGHFPSFLTESKRLVKVLADAQEALAEPAAGAPKDPYLTSDYEGGGGGEFGPPASTPGGAR
jgi:hypothetical protein